MRKTSGSFASTAYFARPGWSGGGRFAPSRRTDRPGRCRSSGYCSARRLRFAEGVAKAPTLLPLWRVPAGFYWRVGSPSGGNYQSQSPPQSGPAASPIARRTRLNRPTANSAGPKRTRSKQKRQPARPAKADAASEISAGSPFAF